MHIDPSPTISNLGGKGFQLTLLREVCPVPDFFIVYFDSKDEIENDDVQKQILHTFETHSFHCVSVRSSATMEDSKTASFAGVFESELNVTKNDLIHAIQNVLSSMTNERVIEYCSINKLNFRSIEMRVIVQKMVNSRISGVCITKIRKESDTLLLEACLGLGEALVSGLVTPDTYKVNRTTLTVESETIGFQKVMIPAFKRSEHVPVPFYQQNSKKLRLHEINEISKSCLKIEEHIGYESADIEWAYEGSTLYILQARPFIGQI